jgi:hypothetical protein
VKPWPLQHPQRALAQAAELARLVAQAGPEDVRRTALGKHAAALDLELERRAGRGQAQQRLELPHARRGDAAQEDQRQCRSSAG